MDKFLLLSSSGFKVISLSFDFCFTQPAEASNNATAMSEDILEYCSLRQRRRTDASPSKPLHQPNTDKLPRLTHAQRATKA